MKARTDCWDQSVRAFAWEKQMDEQRVQIEQEQNSIQLWGPDLPPFTVYAPAVRFKAFLKSRGQLTEATERQLYLFGVSGGTVDDDGIIVLYGDAGRFILRPMGAERTQVEPRFVRSLEQMDANPEAYEAFRWLMSQIASGFPESGIVVEGITQAPTNEQAAGIPSPSEAVQQHEYANTASSTPEPTQTSHDAMTVRRTRGGGRPATRDNIKIEKVMGWRAVRGTGPTKEQYCAAIEVPSSTLWDWEIDLVMRGIIPRE